MEITNKAEYQDQMFDGVPLGTVAPSAIPEAHKEAIKQALDIRKFEIDLYWKRATYFWAFIGASFVAYFALVSSANHLSLKKHVLLVSVIGFIFSYFWYFVNRGSKFWQDNWEKHVDYLEDLSIGALYKIVLNPNNSNFFNPISQYPMSVSKINQLLSLIISCVWLFMINRAIKNAFVEISCCCNLVICLAGLALISMALYFFCRSTAARNKTNSKAIFIKREII